MLLWMLDIIERTSLLAIGCRLDRLAEELSRSPSHAFAALLAPGHSNGVTLATFAWDDECHASRSMRLALEAALQGALDCAAPCDSSSACWCRRSAATRR